MRRFIEGLVAIHQEPTGVVIGRHLEAITDLDIRHARVVSELGTCPLGRTQGFIQELWSIIDEELERELNGLKAARELVFFKGRFRLSLSPVNI